MRATSLALAAFLSFGLVGFGLVAIGQAPPTAVQNDSAKWEYEDVDLIAGPVTLFLVCVDGQATASCAQVPVSAGVVTAPGVKTWTWKLPPLAVGSHTVAVQACTAAAASCSSGVSMTFVVQIIANPKNLRLGSR